MHLSRHNAEEIVQEINTIINRSVNMMNERGVIIASTDMDRVGQIHEGARKIIEQQLDELLIYPDNQYGGSLEGVNYPIVVREQMVGVVGITGPCDEVAQYGKITKKLTEILLQEISVKEQKSMDEKVRWRFLGEWLQNENVIINNNFVDRGKRMHLDITIPRRIMMISILETENNMDDVNEMRRMERAERKVKDVLERADPNSIYMKVGSNQMCGVTNRSDREMENLAISMKQTVEEQTQVELAVGIDDKCHPYTMTHISFSKAYKALQSCLRKHKSIIRFYHDINMEIFTDEISDSSKKEYVQRLFVGYEMEEMTEVIGILETLYESEGSITKASEKLHMHKNTLQYKLKRIYEKTGCDPRSIKASSLFYIAIYFFREIRDIIDVE